MALESLPFLTAVYLRRFLASTIGTLLPIEPSHRFKVDCQSMSMAGKTSSELPHHQSQAATESIVIDMASTITSSPLSRSLPSVANVASLPETTHIRPVTRLGIKSNLLSSDSLFLHHLSTLKYLVRYKSPLAVSRERTTSQLCYSTTPKSIASDADTSIAHTQVSYRLSRLLTFPLLPRS